MHNLLFEYGRFRAKEILYIVHTNSNGPHHNSVMNPEKYFSILIDDCSKVAVCVLNRKLFS